MDPVFVGRGQFMAVIVLLSRPAQHQADEEHGQEHSEGAQDVAADRPHCLGRGGNDAGNVRAQRAAVRQEGPPVRIVDCAAGMGVA